jgi:hypothetical protein
LRDSAGISPDFARSRCPDVVRSTRTIASNASGGTLGSIRRSTAATDHPRAVAIFGRVKRTIIALIAIGAAGVLATYRISNRRVIPPEPASGSWEPSEQPASP